MVGKLPGRIFQRVQIFDSQGGKLTQRPACFKGRLHGGKDSSRDLASHFLHDRSCLCHTAEGLADSIQFGHVRTHTRGNPGHRAGKVVDHVHNE